MPFEQEAVAAPPTSTPAGRTTWDQPVAAAPRRFASDGRVGAGAGGGESGSGARSGAGMRDARERRDPLATLLASAVARRGLGSSAGPVLARRTTILDDPNTPANGIHQEFVGTTRQRINPDITYGPLQDDCGTSMTALLFPDLDFEGSEPKPGTWPWWWAAAGGPDNPDYWVRGHLLNENLGGPGEQRNLTPITKKCNSQHHALVEHLCKLAFDQGQLITYHVVPHYDGVGPPLQNTAKNPHSLCWGYIATRLDCEWLFQDANANPVGQGNASIPNTH